MQRANRQNSLSRGVAGKLVSSLCFVLVTGMHVRGETKTAHGTVNIALANANGIVLLTDSVKSTEGRALPEPTQKLFQLDDKTVCSIAGFVSETGWPRPQFDTEVAGIVADFKDKLSTQPIPDLEVKLRALGFLVGFYIDLVANRSEVVVGPGKPEDYIFQVIVAGYDADGKPKIGKLVLSPVSQQSPDGHKFWSHTVSPEMHQVGRKLVPVLGGIPYVSNEVLNSPQKFSSDSKVVRRYMSAMRRDRGESLTLQEMAALASYMAAQTTKRYPSVVGPPNQIAVLTHGKIVKLEQPHFSNPPRPMKFALMVNLRIQRDLMAATPPDTYMLWIRSEFVGFRNPRLRLDDQFFYGCVIRDSIVEYGGGLTDFGPTNTVVNSFILPGYPVGSQTEMLRILNGFPTGANTKLFKWSDEVPNTPLLDPSISPR